MDISKSNSENIFLQTPNSHFAVSNSKVSKAIQVVCRQPILKNIKPRVFHTTACLISNCIDSFISKELPLILLVQVFCLCYDHLNFQGEGIMNGESELVKATLACRYLLHSGARSLLPSHMQKLPFVVDQTSDTLL